MCGHQKKARQCHMSQKTTPENHGCVRVIYIDYRDINHMHSFKVQSIMVMRAWGMYIRTATRYIDIYVPPLSLPSSANRGSSVSVAFWANHCHIRCLPFSRAVLAIIFFFIAHNRVRYCHIPKARRHFSSNSAIIVYHNSRSSAFPGNGRRHTTGSLVLSTGNRTRDLALKGVQT